MSKYKRQIRSNAHTPKGSIPNAVTQAAIAAMFRALGDKLREQMTKDGIDVSKYGLLDVEDVQIDRDGTVLVAFSGAYSFRQPIQELVSDSEDAPAIFALLRGHPAVPPSS